MNNNDLDSLKPLVRVGMRVDILSSREDRRADGIVESEEESTPEESVEADREVAPEVVSRPAETLSTTQTTPVAEAAESTEEVWYTVVDGDLVGSIARRYGTSTARIVELNPGLNPDRISIGDRIRVR